MFYMIGRDKSRTYWRLLKIDRLDPSELNVHEDSATYTESECSELLRRVHEGNKSTGGLKFVTTCYGIVGMWLWWLSCMVAFAVTQLMVVFTMQGSSSFWDLTTCCWLQGGGRLVLSMDILSTLSLRLRWFQFQILLFNQLLLIQGMKAGASSILSELCSILMCDRKTAKPLLKREKKGGKRQSFLFDLIFQPLQLPFFVWFSQLSMELFLS